MPWVKHCRSCTCGPDGRLFWIILNADRSVTVRENQGSTRIVSGPAEWQDDGHWTSLGDGRYNYHRPDGQVAASATFTPGR